MHTTRRLVATGAALFVLGGIAVGLSQDFGGNTAFPANGGSAPTSTPIPPPSTLPVVPTVWTTVVSDNFNSGATYPAHWTAYTGHYRANCAAASHNTVSGGFLHMRLSYEPAGFCGPGWYSGGLTLDESLSAPNQRVTIRFRIVSVGAIQGHRIVPMLNPNDGTGIGEHDLCESTPYEFCSSFLHYGAKGTTQIRKKYAVDLTVWHTMVFTRDGYHFTSSIDGVVKLDYTGDETTLPSKLRHVVLQQECNKLGCPTGTTGSEDIQVSSIRVDNGT